MSVNASEAFCLGVCHDTFLSLWSYANPQGKQPSHELCDILVVCEPDVIIISVKDCALADSGDKEKDWRRWRKKAVRKSVDQIYGAERCLRGQSHVIRNDGKQGLPLPPSEEMRVHRVAVAFGGKGEVPFHFGDFGKGFVHVLDERSFRTLLQELDTITDFIDYLAAKEAHYAQGKGFVAFAEEDMLAIYLHGNRRFPDANIVLADGGSWDQLIHKPEKQAKTEADQISYLWDKIINKVGQDTLAGTLECGSSLEYGERVLREMARESRFERRFLAKAFEEFLQKSKTAEFARYCQSPSGRAYVFLAMARGTERADRQKELKLRCTAAKNDFIDVDVIMGIATEQYVPEAGYSLDLYFFAPGVWTDEDQADAKKIREIMGYLEDPIVTFRHEEEYPGAGDSVGT